ncbi:MAG: sigma-70 family RNA polymerase sigma factor [Planctomycetes bacterium]|nr:sigma-70 family RNA polymerase sigma factor [Planctomycetota bacterium]
MRILDESPMKQNQPDPANKSALAELHERFAPGLLRFFQRKVSGGGLSSQAYGDRADELAQRTWIEFWKALQSGSYDPTRAKHSTFLYAVASIIWLRSVREEGRNSRIGVLPDSDEWLPTSQADDPSHAADLASAIEVIRRVVAGSEPAAPFGDDDRVILRAVADDCSEREIAAQLGVSPSTAHERKRAVLARIADFLRGKGIDLSQNRRAQEIPTAKKQ